MEKKPGAQMLKRITAMLLVCVISFQSITVYAEKSQYTWSDFDNIREEDSATEEGKLSGEELEEENQEEKPNGETEEDVEKEEPDGETEEGVEKEEPDEETEEDVEKEEPDEEGIEKEELEEKTEEEESNIIEDIFEHGKIKIYNLEQLYAIGTDQAVTTRDMEEETFGTGEEIFYPREEDRNSICTETSTSSNASVKSQKIEDRETDEDEDEPEQLVTYSLDADYELVQDISLEPDCRKALQEVLAENPQKRPGCIMKKQIPSIFIIITSC